MPKRRLKRPATKKVQDKKIVRNSAICLLCNTEIESKYHHHFHSCPCGALSVDGGQDYLRRLGDLDSYKDTSTYEDYERDPYPWETEEWLKTKQEDSDWLPREQDKKES